MWRAVKWFELECSDVMCYVVMRCAVRCCKFSLRIVNVMWDALLCSDLN